MWKILAPRGVPDARGARHHGQNVRVAPLASEASRRASAAKVRSSRGGALLIIGFCASLAAGCNRNTKPATEVVRPVKTMIVVAGDESRVRSLPGTVEASRRVELRFRVAGLLTKFPVKEGQRVKEGDLIAQLRQDEFKARLKTLQGELDQARASLRALRAGERPEEIRRREAQLRAAQSRLANARSVYERNARLVRDRVVSRQEYEQSESAYRVAQEEHTAALKSLNQATAGREEDVEAMEAQVRGLEGRLVEAQIQLGDATLLAPYDGVIAQRFVDEGQNITANDRVVQFQDVDEVDIAVDVPETVMAEIQLADIERLSAELSAAPGVEFPVQIREVAQVADPVTQTFNVRVAMEAPQNIRALPGMSARVTVSYHRASILGERLLVPVEAIMEKPSGDPVAWVLGEESAVAPRIVKLGSVAGGRIEVVDGLAAGDRIVVAGVRFLREGMKVRDLGEALGGGAR
jgi:RND family efflux transporter MFP subunit